MFVFVFCHRVSHRSLSTAFNTHSQYPFLSNFVFIRHFDMSIDEHSLTFQFHFGR